MLQKIPGAVLQNLRYLHENPPSVHVSMSAEVQNSLSDMSRTDAGHFQTGEPMDADLSMGGIDWNISVDDAQIDWDIGTVEQVEESDNGFGSYELVDYSADYQESENGKAMLVDEESLKTAEDEAAVLADSGSGICWDAGLKKSQFATLEDSVVTDAGVESQQIAIEKSQPSRLDEERSPFLETEYRNKILDDLFEVFYLIYYNSCLLSMLFGDCILCITASNFPFFCPIYIEKILNRIFFTVLGH